MLTSGGHDTDATGAFKLRDVITWPCFHVLATQFHRKAALTGLSGTLCKRLQNFSANKLLVDVYVGIEHDIRLKGDH